tara:strand:- start:117 stop:299 length:183 start_codon:yes stop_codon:yes gene_type:complete
MSHEGNDTKAERDLEMALEDGLIDAQGNPLPEVVKTTGNTQLLADGSTVHKVGTTTIRIL